MERSGDERSGERVEEEGVQGHLAMILSTRSSVAKAGSTSWQ